LNVKWRKEKNIRGFQMIRDTNLNRRSAIRELMGSKRQRQAICEGEHAFLVMPAGGIIKNNKTISHHYVCNNLTPILCREHTNNVPYLQGLLGCFGT
jgi:hypothetical protein